MSAGQKGQQAHQIATQRLEIAAQIRVATDALEAIGTQKDKLDQQFAQCEKDLNALNSRPDMPAPNVTVDTGAADHAAQLAKAAAEELDRAKEEERISAEMETIGDAKDGLDEQHKTLLAEVNQLQAQFAGLKQAA